MKNKKTIILLVLLTLVLVIGTSTGTYAYFQSRFRATGTAKVAKWSVKVDGQSSSQSNFALNFDKVYKLDASYPDRPTSEELAALVPGSQTSASFTVDVDVDGVQADMRMYFFTTQIPDNVEFILSKNGEVIEKEESYDEGSTYISLYDTYDSSSSSDVYTIILRWPYGDAIDPTDNEALQTDIVVPVNITATQRN